MILWVL